MIPPLLYARAGYLVGYLGRVGLPCRSYRGHNFSVRVRRPTRRADGLGVGYSPASTFSKRGPYRQNRSRPRPTSKISRPTPAMPHKILGTSGQAATTAAFVACVICCGGSCYCALRTMLRTPDGNHEPFFLRVLTPSAFSCRAIAS